MSAEQDRPVNQAAQEYLTDQDKFNLTVYKLRYTAEAKGFTPEQAADLVFAKWEVHHGVIGKEDTSAPINAFKRGEIIARLEGRDEEQKPADSLAQEWKNHFVSQGFFEEAADNLAVVKTQAAKGKIGGEKDGAKEYKTSRRVRWQIAVERAEEKLVEQDEELARIKREKQELKKILSFGETTEEPAEQFPQDQPITATPKGSTEEQKEEFLRELAEIRRQLDEQKTVR